MCMLRSLLSPTSMSRSRRALHPPGAPSHCCRCCPHCCLPCCPCCRLRRTRRRCSCLRRTRRRCPRCCLPPCRSRRLRQPCRCCPCLRCWSLRRWRSLPWLTLSPFLKTRGLSPFTSYKVSRKGRSNFRQHVSGSPPAPSQTTCDNESLQVTT